MHIFPYCEEYGMDGQTDGQTEGQTDIPSYRDARTHLKINSKKGRTIISSHFMKFQAKRDRKLRKIVHLPRKIRYGQTEGRMK